MTCTGEFTRGHASATAEEEGLDTLRSTEVGGLQTRHDAVFDDMMGERAAPASTPKEMRERDGEMNALCEFEEVHGVDEDFCFLFWGETLCDVSEGGVEDAWVDDICRGGGDEGLALDVAGRFMVWMRVRLMMRHPSSVFVVVFLVVLVLVVLVVVVLVVYFSRTR